MTRDDPRQDAHTPDNAPRPVDERPQQQVMAGEAGDPIWEQAGPPPHGRGTPSGSPREECVPGGRLIDLGRPRPRQATPPPQQRS
jgi:hypothetical protein